MKRKRGWLLALVLLAMGGWALASRSAPPADPLRLLPPDAYVVIKVDRALPAVRWLLDQATRPELKGFAAYRELMESTTVRRAQQLLAYAEKELGRAWPSLLEQLTDGGIAFAADKPAEGQPVKALLVLQGSRPELAEQALKLFITVAEQELARQENKLRYVYETYQGVSIAKVADTFCLAASQGAVFAASSPAVLKQALDRQRDPSLGNARGIARLNAARTDIPEQALAWFWFDLAAGKEAADANFKRLMEVPTPEPIPHIVLGGLFDVVRRSDWLTLDLTATGPDLVLSIRMPAGREGMGIGGRAHSRGLDEPGPRPFFWPADAFYAAAFMWDPYLFWDKRAEFVVPNVQKEFEEGDQKSGVVLLGRRLSTILQCWGTRHQFIATRPHPSGYQITPKQKLPAFALVSELRDPEAFAKHVEPLLRAGAFIGSLNVSMSMKEVPQGDLTIVSYRFAENERNRASDGGMLFNFTPSFVRVKNYFIVASTLDLARSLVEEVQRGTQVTSWQEAASSRQRLSFAGIRQFLAAVRPQAETQAILQSGLPPEEARRELEQLFDLLARLGTVDLAVFYEARSFRAELRTHLGTK